MPALRTSSIPDTMNAAAIDRFGPPSTLTLHRLPVPEPGANEVLIALETAGVGIWDASIRDGSWRKPGRTRFPLIPAIAASYPLGKAAQAHRRLDRGRILGRLVLQLRRRR